MRNSGRTGATQPGWGTILDWVRFALAQKCLVILTNARLGNGIRFAYPPTRGGELQQNRYRQPEAGVLDYSSLAPVSTRILARPTCSPVLINVTLQSR